ncbi:PfkB family carbohydrate kinase [Pseudalkalibacillus salsuginis]|uniref:PfkB family carbohydrate kinase n=1 Tax=Pseudalkalibacillus salsuginis TaxID=2910972 RepID=UPI0022466BD0|nr:PfkB family carbohydrate kinase [Pseudalkalibacillus salsuginis]
MENHRELASFRYYGIAHIIRSRRNDRSDRCTTWTINPPVVKAVNTVGCGDTLVGALAVGFYNHLTYEECLINATAAAVSNAMEKQAGKVDIEKIDQYKQGIILKKE